MSNLPNVYVGHVKQYTGPGIVDVLAERGYTLICHDASFKDEAERKAFEKNYANGNVTALAAQTAKEVAESLEEFPEVERFVLNDVYPNVPTPIEGISLETLDGAYQALFRFPFELSQLLLPKLKKNKSGIFLFITSARQLQPESGFSIATSIRAGTTAFSLALAREAAPHNIQVNTIQPNYLYSELYYPKAKFIDDPEGRKIIEDTVPMGRLGTPDEFGELVEFYISGRSKFTTGQVVNFTGGWP